MKLDLGTTIDRYVVEALIGAGGTAMVYRVRHGHLGTFHALKVLTITSEAIRTRMLNEGKVQATLQHLNVVAVTDVLNIGGAPGLLMEYIDGPSMERALGTFKIRMGDAETLFMGIVAGVRQAHALGLVHRDLKPANVLLQHSRDGFIPKVTDFGLVKTLSADTTIGATRAGIAMGTPSYMAPEQVRDARTVDQRADIWSLGCILYELVTRRRAFPGEEALDIYNAVTVGDFPEPRRWVQDLPERLEHAILGCLTVDREQRIPDCDTLLAVMRGEKTWVLPDFPEAEHATEEMPRVLPANVPDMQVARRGPDGQTPGPAPARHGTPSQPLPAVTDTVAFPEAHGVDGTLHDNLEGEEDGGEGLWALGVAVSMLLAAGVLAVMLGILGTAVYLLQPPGPESAPMATETTPPEPARRAIEEPPDAESEPPEPASAKAPVASPKPAPAAEPVPAPDPKVVRIPVTEPAPAPAPRTVVKPVAAEPEVVKIFSSPPTASVQLNGVTRGRTPLRMELAPGRYTVNLTSGGLVATYAVEVEPGGTNNWCYVFASAKNVQGGCP